jgi:hypothetical protein
LRRSGSDESGQRAEQHCLTRWHLVREGEHQRGCTGGSERLNPDRPSARSDHQRSDHGDRCQREADEADLDEAFEPLAVSARRSCSDPHGEPSPPFGVCSSRIPEQEVDRCAFNLLFGQELPSAHAPCERAVGAGGLGNGLIQALSEPIVQIDERYDQCYPSETHRSDPHDSLTWPLEHDDSEQPNESGQLDGPLL